MNQNVRRTNTKVCSICKKEKVVGAKNWYRNSTCAACYQKRYKKNFPDRSRDSKLKCYYGISLEQFNTLLKEQDFKCAICKIPENKLKNGKIQNFVVDHCHTTKKGPRIIMSYLQYEGRDNRKLGLSNYKLFKC